MPNFKHVGRQISNKRACVVAFRTIPNDPHNCLVIFSDSLPSDEHDTMFRALESEAGQNSYELADILNRTRLPDGRLALPTFHAQGRLVKVPTNSIEMTPNTGTTLRLDELNNIIASQRGISLEDICYPPGTPIPERTATQTPVNYVEDNAVSSSSNEVLTDDAIAAQLRSQADAMFKEAKRLREQAEELAPTKKKTVKNTESAET